jgi:hypothetical protein
LPHIQGQLHLRSYSMCTRRFVIALLTISCRKIWLNISGHWQEWKRTRSSIILSCFHIFPSKLCCLFELCSTFELCCIIFYIFSYCNNYIYFIWCVWFYCVSFQNKSLNWGHVANSPNASGRWACSQPKRLGGRTAVT